MEIQQVINDGAHEIDVVVNQGAFLGGDIKTVEREIRQMRKESEGITMKVILETCELETHDNIRLASSIAIAEGADFIKTSTGFGKYGATFEHVAAMLDVIAEEYKASGRMIGMKPAGGVKTCEDALTYMFLVEEMLGNDWLNSELFRYGASSLLPAVVDAVEKHYGFYPPTGELVRAFTAMPTFSFDIQFPDLVPYIIPDMIAAIVDVGPELPEKIDIVRKIEDDKVRNNELLRIARFFSAYTGYSIEDSIELLGLMGKSKQPGDAWHKAFIECAFEIHQEAMKSGEGLDLLRRQPLLAPQILLYGNHAAVFHERE